MPKLTKRIVDSATPRTAPYFRWCSELSGFGIRIFPSGRKVYYADYRSPTGVRRRIALGQHGKLTAEEARRLAAINLGDVLKGSDPADERVTRRKSLTVAQLCDRYFAATDRNLVLGKRGLPKKQSTLATDRGRVQRHIKPLLGRKLVRDLTTVDITRFMRDVTSGKTAATVTTGKLRGKAIVTGGRGTAARTVGLLGGILSYAVSEGVIPSNPARGVQRPADGQRRRRLTPEEYRRLGDVLREGKGEQSHAIHGAWLLAVTGCRLGEITNLKWDEIDFGRRCLRFGDSKEGPSLRPLGSEPIKVLARIGRQPGNPHVLAASSGRGHYTALPRAWRQIVAKSGLVGVTPHSLRHSFASVANDLGFTLPTVAALLGHSTGTVTSNYVHHMDDVLIAAADKVGKEIVRQMSGKPASTTTTTGRRTRGP